MRCFHSQKNTLRVLRIDSFGQTEKKYVNKIHKSNVLNVQTVESHMQMANLIKNQKQIIEHMWPQLFSMENYINELYV